MINITILKLADAPCLHAPCLQASLYRSAPSEHCHDTSRRPHATCAGSMVTPRAGYRPNMISTSAVPCMQHACQAHLVHGLECTSALLIYMSAAQS